MKYASEVIDLMAAFPGRSFRLMELVRHVSGGRPLSATEKTRLQRGIQRAMAALEEAGSVVISPSEGAWHGFEYQWRVTISSHQAPNYVTKVVTMGAG